MLLIYIHAYIDEIIYIHNEKWLLLYTYIFYIHIYTRIYKHKIQN